MLTYFLLKIDNPNFYDKNLFWEAISLLTQDVYIHEGKRII